MTPQEKCQNAANEMFKVAQNHNLNDGEYLFILQTLSAAALSVNKKSTENEFHKRLRKDILDRRVAALNVKGKVL